MGTLGLPLNRIVFEKDKRYHRLVLVEDAGKIKGKKKWKCFCDCGNIKVVDASAVRLGLTKSCGCKHDEDFVKNSQKARLPRLPYGHGLANSLLGHYRYRAKRKNIYFDLTREQFRELIHKDCFYCGKPPAQHKKYNKPSSTEVLTYNGIDRIDNKLGYTITNVVPCCSACNTFKMTQTTEEFFGLVKTIYEKHNLGMNEQTRTNQVYPRAEDRPM